MVDWEKASVQNFVGFDYHVSEILSYGSAPFFFFSTQISLSYHPPDLYHSRTRDGD